MQNYKTEFPRFTGPMPVFKGFIDVSWHNDACPSFHLPLGGESFLRVWVDFANPEDRDSPFHERYCVDLMHDDECSTVLRTDDLEMVHSVCEIVRQRPIGVATFLCCWNKNMFELHTEQSLRAGYSDTNLFDLGGILWAQDNEPDIEIVLRKLKTGRYDWNACDNLVIYRVSPKGVL